MITATIDVKKIDKSLLFVGKKGTYLEVVFFDKPNEYGDAGFCKQGVTKEQRESGIQGPIIGNWKDSGGSKPKPKPQAQKQLANQPFDENADDIPF